MAEQLRQAASRANARLATGDEMLTIPELAAELKTTVEQVYKLNHQGRAPRRLKVGGLIRYRRSDVDQWIKDHMVLDATGLNDAGEQ